MSEYLDFELEIGAGDGHEYPVAVVRSPAGETRSLLRWPFGELELDNRLLTLQNALLRSGGQRRSVMTPDEERTRQFGGDLFNLLFADDVRSLYFESQREATHQGMGLRLKLRINAPELAALPWEFLYDPRSGDYLCLSKNTPVVRYIELPRPIQPLTVQPPLRILGMVASPKDLPQLNVAVEKLRVERGLDRVRRRGAVELSWLDGQAWRDLQRALRHGPWHIFHFVGHGGFDQRTGEGLVMVADERENAFPLTATHLARLLADHNALRLAVFSSCEGARGSSRDLFSSTAAVLVRAGIPAVLAMQYEITDAAAMEMSATFYEALADGLPVDEAVCEARKAISVAVSNSLEWGTPVLYTRMADGVIFDMRRADQERIEPGAYGAEAIAANAARPAIQHSEEAGEGAPPAAMAPTAESEVAEAGATAMDAMAPQDVEPEPAIPEAPAAMTPAVTAAPRAAESEALDAEAIPAAMTEDAALPTESELPHDQSAAAPSPSASLMAGTDELRPELPTREPTRQTSSTPAADSGRARRRRGNIWPKVLIAGVLILLIGYAGYRIGMPIYAQRVMDEGMYLARVGNYSAAVAKLYDALSLNPDLAIDPEVDAGRVAMPAMIDWARSLAEMGSPEEAQRQLDELLPVAATLDDSYIDLSICMLRDQDVLAEAVAPVCAGVFANALPIDAGVPVTGTLANGGHDLWAFDAKAGQAVSLRMQADESNLNSHVTVYGPDELGDPREIIHTANRYVPSPSGDRLHAGLEGLVLPVDGQYLIVAGADENTSGRYRLAMDTLSEGEARPFVGAALAAQARSLAEAGDMENAIDKVEAAQAIAQELNLLPLYFTLCQMQMYEELRDAVARSCVNLTALAPVIKPGMVGAGVIDSPFSDPWLWDIQSSSVVSIALSALIASDSDPRLDPYLTLYDPHLQLIAENDDIDNLNRKTNSLLDDVELTAPGVYWITAGRCCPYDDEGSTGKYTLEVEIQRELE